MSTHNIDPQFLTPNAWLGYLGDETLCLVDLYTGQRLDPNTPPQALQRQDELAVGLSYLERNSAMITVVPYYSRHDNRADLGDPDLFENQIRGSDFFAYESLNPEFDGLYRRASRNVMRAIDDIGAPQTLDNYLKVWNGLYPVEPKELGQYEFVRRLFRGIILHPQPSLPIEIREDGTTLERDLTAVNRAIGNDSTTIGELAVSMAITNLMDWVRIARLGCELEEQTGPTPKERIEVSTWQGLAHRDASRKLDCLGLRVEPERLLGEIPPIVSNKWELLSEGTITISALQALAARI